MSELPKGWKKSTFGDVLALITNGLNGKQNKDGQGIPVSRIETIAEQQVDLSRVGFLETYDEEKIGKYLLKEGEILFSHINSPIHLGKTALVPKGTTLYHGVNLLRLACNEKVEPRFFNYHCKYLRALGEFSKNAQHAVNQSSINQKKLKAFEILLPDYSEQKRIADKLDSVLAKVEAAQTRLDKIPAILKRFRQSVLAAATSGELTKDWRLVNDKNEDWDSVFLKEISSSIRSGSGKKPTDECEGVPMLRSSAVRVLEVDYDDFRTISETLLSERDYISNDDLLFTRLSGSKEYVGNCSKVTGIKNKIAFPDRLFKVELKNKKLASFIEIYCSSPNYFKYIEASIKSSAGHQRITTEVIKNIVIRLPTETEQNLIVSKVNELFERADGIQKQYDTARIRLAKLTQSILAKAFKGELLSSSVDSDIKSIENSVEALNA